jgi:hypothetical protein
LLHLSSFQIFLLESFITEEGSESLLQQVLLIVILENLLGMVGNVCVVTPASFVAPIMGASQGGQVHSFQ